jgi:anti-anti-sigma factor
VSPSQFGVETRRAHGRLTIQPSGELDIATVGRVRELVEQRQPGEAVELDLRRLDFLDTSGLQLVVELHRAARAEGYELILVRGAPGVQRVFELAGLDDVLGFVDAPPPAD